MAFRNLALTGTAGLVLSACAATTGHYGTADELSVHNAKTSSAQEALRSYYTGLNAALPKAPPGVNLDESTVITRFAFGSCANENRDMQFWDVIAAQNPQAFLMIGDNVYGDTGATAAADIPTLTASYRKLNSRQEYYRFRSKVPMLTVWDDHDFGANDGGGTFAFKEYAERIFEEYWDSSDEVRARPGVYESHLFGPIGKRVQFIMLDARFFRSDLVRQNYQDPPPKLGWTMANMDPKATVLGQAQWEWLAGELSKPADIRFIISSTQVITDAHNFEGWFNFPLERKKLYTLLSEKRVNNAVLLTGDRHSGAMYSAQVSGLNKPLYEFTSTSLNLSYGAGDNSAREPDPSRLGGFWADENFGQIDIDWAAKKVKMTLKQSGGKVLEERTIAPIG